MAKRQGMSMFTGLSMKSTANAVTHPTGSYEPPPMPASTPSELHSNSYQSSNSSLKGTSQCEDQETAKDPFANLEIPVESRPQRQIHAFDDSLRVESQKEPKVTEKQPSKPKATEKQPEKPKVTEKQPEKPKVTEKKTETPQESENKFAKILEDKKKKGLEDKRKREQEEQEKQQRQQQELELYSDTEKFTEFINEYLGNVQGNIQEKLRQQAVLQEKQNELLEENNTLQDTFRATEQLEEEAANKEDFEEAARYHEEEEELQNRIRSNLESLHSNSQKEKQLEQLKSELYEQEKLWLESVLGKASGFHQQHEESLESSKQQFALITVQKEQYFASERQELAEKQEILTECAEQAQNKHNELTTRISEKTGEYDTAKAALQEEVCTLTNEISELTETLAMKRALLADQESTLAQTENSIKTLTEEFQEELDLSHKDLAELHREQLKLEQTTRSLEQEETETADSATASEAEIAARSAQVALFEHTANTLKTRLTEVTSTISSRASALLEVSQAEQSHQDKQEILTEAVEYLELSKQEAERLREALKGHQEKILEIELRVPNLESEKKAAAANKQFKEAARVAGEIKVLCSEQDSLRTTVCTLEAEVHDKEQELLSVILI